MLSGELDDKAYEISDAMARIGSDEAMQAMIQLLGHPEPETRYLAARTMSLMKDNSAGLEPLLSFLQDPLSKGQVGDLLSFLEEFDISGHYVEIFKHYLFGNYKVSMVAKDLLDHKDFEITPRVIKKATKHWNHYTNNVKHDELFALKKAEVEEVLADLQKYVDS